MVICKNAQVLKQDTLLATLADPSGDVDLTAVRFDTNPSEMARAALARARLYAEEGAWGAWSRELSEVDRLEAEQRRRMESSTYSDSIGSSSPTP